MSAPPKPGVDGASRKGRSVLRNLGPLGIHFARDRLLLVFTILLSLSALLPLFLTRYLPLTDLSQHAALASLGKLLWAGDPVVSQFFEFQPRPSPYWLFYLLLMGVGELVGPVLATHVVVGLAVLLVPLSFMRLMVALGRSPRLGLLAFAVAWDFNISMGFIAYSLAVAFSFFFVARVLEGLRGGRWTSRPEIAKTALLALLLPNTHAQATAATGVLLMLLALSERANRRHFRWLAVWAVLPVLGVLPWVFTTPTGSGGPVPPFDQWLYWAPANERVELFMRYSLGFVRGQLPGQVQGMTVLLLLFGPLFLVLRGMGSRRVSRRAWTLYGGACLLYLALPASLFWPFHQILIYERYSTFILLFGLLLPASGLSFSGRASGLRLSGSPASKGVTASRGGAWPRGLRVTVLSLGLTLSFASTWVVAWFCARFDDYAAQVEEVLEAIPPGKTIMPVIYTLRTPEALHEVLAGITIYYHAGKGGFSPHVFATPNLPVRRNADASLPFALWKDPDVATIREHGRYYDYVLIQGKEHDKFRAGPAYRSEDGTAVRLAVEAENDDFRLYSVHDVRRGRGRGRRK